MDNATLSATEMSLGLATVKMAASLLLVVGLILLLLYLLKRYGLATRWQGRGTSLLHVEERLVLGPRKQVLVVRFLNRILVLGVTDSSINLIAEHTSDDAQSLDFSTALEREKQTHSVRAD
ncbi:MAG: flagellar biosynthetic protein FliO [Desulfovibrionales bacterium]|nr:flagellar biosynthetic protein FliO [Desulfovibrionales bacterium]